MVVIVIDIAFGRLGRSMSAVRTFTWPPARTYAWPTCGDFLMTMDDPFRCSLSRGPLPSHTNAASGCSHRVRLCLAWEPLRHDLNDLTGERIDLPRVGASVDADCSRLPNIGRYWATAKAPDSVLRQQGTKGIDTQRNSSPMTCRQRVTPRLPGGVCGTDAEQRSGWMTNSKGSARRVARGGR